MKESRIKILDDTLISQIAAGEVIERPFSVVKELVENSIDAGATQISIEIKHGGKSLIRVVDNGCGMDKEEAKLALERHSTSKINSSDDLHNIKTLGFRGEALPSIASVSKVEILTKVPRSNSGTQIICEGGRINKASEYGCPEGTSITIKELFFNTPARLKFLKSTNTELTHIINIASKFILSNPSISFKLINDGIEIFTSPGGGKLVDAIASVYGVDMVDTLVEVINNQDTNIKIWGYVSQPVISKSDRGDESFFVNGRYVRNLLLSKALENSYKNLMPNNRYPISVLFIEIDPQKIDVNVHPAKREIKFQQPNEVLNLIRNIVTNVLSSIKPDNVSPSELPVGEMPDYIKADPMAMFGESNSNNKPVSEEYIASESAIPRVESELKALIQIADTYIVAIKAEELILIDQHAAHERILFEKFKKKTVYGSQKLLINITIQVSPSEYARLNENLDYLHELGFELEPFGKNTFIVKAIPSLLEINQAKEAIESIIKDLIDVLGIKNSLERKEHVLKMLACKGAVKAGDKLNFEEMNKLIEELFQTEYAVTCPHGRPTIFKLSKNDLEKIFKRK